MKIDVLNDIFPTLQVLYYHINSEKQIVMPDLKIKSNNYGICY